MNERQLDGFACIFCGGETAPMVVAGYGSRGQLFRCVTECVVSAVSR